MSIFSHTNDSRHNQPVAATKHWSLIPEVVMVMALAWFCFDLAFRLDGYQESFWMVDLDMLSILALIVGAGVLAVRHHAQSAEQLADEYHRQISSNSKPPQFRVSDGGMGLPANKSQSDKRKVKETTAYFDGGTFPARKHR